MRVSYKKYLNSHEPHFIRTWIISSIIKRHNFNSITYNIETSLQCIKNLFDYLICGKYTFISNGFSNETGNIKELSEQIYF